VMEPKLRGRPFDAILPQSSLQNHNFPRKVAHSERIRAFLRIKRFSDGAVPGRFHFGHHWRHQAQHQDRKVKPGEHYGRQSGEDLGGLEGLFPGADGRFGGAL
jgi:hypothetical protein